MTPEDKPLAQVLELDSLVAVEVQEVRRLQLQPGDIVIVRTRAGVDLDDEQRDQLMHVFARLGAQTGTRWMIDDVGMEFEVVTPSRLVTP